MKGINWHGLVRRRILFAGQNCFDGFKACFEHEEAFRVEVVLGLIFFCLAPFVATNLVEWAMLVSVLLIVLIVELLNSAVEAAIDRISDEYHELSKRAKDLASAAVLLSIVLFAVTWGALLLS